MMNIHQILYVGAFLVVVAGVVGGFYGGFKRTKSTNENDADISITLKDKAINALKGEVAELNTKVQQQEKRITELELLNATYVKLFQGNPSQLETYMKTTSESIAKLADGMSTVLALIQQSKPVINVNN